VNKITMIMYCLITIQLGIVKKNQHLKKNGERKLLFFDKEKGNY
jgi:hypothetical protein